MANVYIAGPMGGIPDFNRYAFDAAAHLLRLGGYDVCNPVDHDVEVYGPEIMNNPTGDVKLAERLFGFDRRKALAWDLAWIAEYADSIYMLSGWEKSSGANAEWALAKALGLEIMYED